MGLVYPRLVERVKAVFIDTVIWVILMIAATQVLAQFSNVPDSVRVGIAIFIFLLYDPILTSSFGGTIGHMISNIRVKRADDESRNIMFPLALIRFILKTLLGWISLLTVNSSEKMQAIHDFVANSVVVYKKQPQD